MSKAFIITVDSCSAHWYAGAIMNAEGITYRFIDTSDPEYVGERELRVRMLREPLGLPYGTEVFPFEDEALHLVAMDGAAVIGCVMFHATSDDGRLLQMAVASKFQGKGIGRRLAKELETRLRDDGFSEIHIHARIEATPFYENLGYSIYGEPFEEVGIEHRLMMKKLIM